MEYLKDVLAKILPAGHAIEVTREVIDMHHRALLDAEYPARNGPLGAIYTLAGTPPPSVQEYIEQQARAAGCEYSRPAQRPGNVIFMRPRVTHRTS